ncbi:hypothetical protein ACRZ5S_22800 (plasmid) [Vibrio scophthalmi]|uniref:hypothetical protein n=1 Tax=Vibrio scophthalmi TaxID=45658 RepID=UPI003EBA7839
MKYIENTYGPKGSFIDSGIAGNRFLLTAHGTAWFDEDEGSTGEYSSERTIELTRHSTLSEVFQSIETLTEIKRVGRDGVNVRDSIDDIASEALDCNSFYSDYFLIYDRCCLVACVVRERGIWQFQDLLLGQAADDAFEKANSLWSEARVESGWDNFSTAQSLRREARLLCYQTESNITNRSKAFLNEMRSLMAIQQTKIEEKARELVVAHAKLQRT